MGENVSLTCEVPDHQVIKYKITPEKGALMTVRSIGGQLEALAKILCLDDGKDDPHKWEAMLQRIDTCADGSIEFTIIVAPKIPAHPPHVREPDHG